jgi:hypothetical protein
MAEELPQLPDSPHYQVAPDPLREVDQRIEAKRASYAAEEEQQVRSAYTQDVLRKGGVETTSALASAREKLRSLEGRLAMEWFQGLTMQEQMALMDLARTSPEAVAQAYNQRTEVN